ncbi:hypothetical protein HELRODRAFT_158316 [Helobdella robusta]|uniref:Uncharacterized protein n=1 Tax=Helobdella robusta TaxID=6412 RepID=T1EMN0_HELRO|nr:hypothetical protein HELRODRAFT_158316 [Helobdella robusta]ESO11952.1 hypothetical protein HELRODRAFT_158316 [Helobdella robusta]
MKGGTSFDYQQCPQWECSCNDYNDNQGPVTHVHYVNSFKTLHKNIQDAKNAVNRLATKIVLDRFGNSDTHAKSLKNCAFAERTSECLLRLFNGCPLSDIPTQAEMETWKHGTSNRMLSVLETAAPMLAHINSYLEQAKVDEADVQDWNKELTRDFSSIQEQAIYKIYCNLIVVFPSSDVYTEYFMESIDEIFDSECRDSLELSARDNRNYVTLHVLKFVLEYLKQQVDHFKTLLTSSNSWSRNQEDISNFLRLEQNLPGKRSTANYSSPIYQYANKKILLKNVFPGMRYNEKKHF